MSSVSVAGRVLRLHNNDAEVRRPRRDADGAVQKRDCELLGETPSMSSATTLEVSLGELDEGDSVGVVICPATQRVGVYQARKGYEARRGGFARSSHRT